MTTPTPTRLLLSNVGYTYAAGTDFAHEALAGIDLAVTPGSYLLITGHTGSGKSTLLRIAAGLLKPTMGTATLDDRLIEPGEVGLVFQQPESQLFAATVAEDVAFGPVNLGKALTREQREQTVRTALEAVGLDPARFGPRSPFTLSGGEARRVALATILAMQPRILLFDEPTAGLDRNGRIFFHQLVAQQMASGAGVVVVSHDIDEFLPRVHTVLTLKGGRAQPATSPAARPPHGTECGCLAEGRAQPAARPPFSASPSEEERVCR